jgi:outer membrane protein assembly factor BamB
MKISEAQVTRQVEVSGVSSVHGVSFDGQRVWFAHGDGGELIALDTKSGTRERSLRVPADAGVAFDGEYLWVAAGSVIRRVHPETGEVVAQIDSPAGDDTSGLGYHDGHLWVGSFKAKRLYKVDAKTGAVKKQLSSNRMVTGVTFRGADLWHGSVASTTASEFLPELRRLDQESGEVTDARSLPADFLVSGTEADSQGRVWCGDAKTGKLRLVELSA